MDENLNTQRRVSTSEEKSGMKYRTLYRGGFEIEYDGNIILLPKEKYRSLINKSKKIEEYEHELNAKKQEIQNLKTQNKENRDLALQATNEAVKIKKELEYYKNFYEKYKSFEDNRKKPVLTPQVKKYIQLGYNQGATVKTIHSILVSHGYEISYETVRRHIANLKR